MCATASPPITAVALRTNAFLCFRLLMSVCRRGGLTALLRNSGCRSPSSAATTPSAGGCAAPQHPPKNPPFFLPAGVTLYRNVGSKWALEQAKYNLLNEFLLVGVTEELEDFIMILEAALPHFFRGATELYRTGRVQANLMRRREG